MEIEGYIRGAFLVQPRDFVGYQEAIIEDDGSIYVFQTSVPEDENTGPVKGRTRGTLTLSGWCIKAVGDDIDVTYLVKGTKPFSPLGHKRRIFSNVHFLF